MSTNIQFFSLCSQPPGREPTAADLADHAELERVALLALDGMPWLRALLERLPLPVFIGTGMFALVTVVDGMPDVTAVPEVAQQMRSGDARQKARTQLQ